MSDTARGSRVGSQFGRYHLTRLLGGGVNGEVYEARDTVKQRMVALKLWSPELSRDPAFRERLQAHAHTVGRLQNPHVVPVHDCGEVDGQLFVDMRLIDGTDLARMLKQSGPLSPARAVVIVSQVASALDAAHAAGVIHRDVKPENILITGDDFVYLADFEITDVPGVDGATPMSAAAGALRYSAPERFTHTQLNHQADIYSLACVLYACVTGSPPYPGADAGALITAHRMQPLPRPSRMRSGLPQAFDEVIARGTAKDPRLRYTSASALARAAYQALSWPAPPYPRPAAAGFPLPQPTGRRRRSTLLTLVVVVAVVALGGTVTWLLRPSRSETAVSDPISTAPTTPAPSPPDTAAQARLVSLLPAGYPPGRCKPIGLPKDALAKLSCGRNTDPDGPPSATFTLFVDTATLHFAFNEVVHNTGIVDCPGRIQSPGPWHRNATPDKTSGMLVCATRKSNPLVGWTNDAESLLAVVNAEPQNPTMDQLYAWWTSHS